MVLCSSKIDVSKFCLIISYKQTIWTYREVAIVNTHFYTSAPMTNWVCNQEFLEAMSRFVLKILINYIHTSPAVSMINYQSVLFKSCLRLFHLFPTSSVGDDKNSMRSNLRCFYTPPGVYFFLFYSVLKRWKRPSSPPSYVRGTRVCFRQVIFVVLHPPPPPFPKEGEIKNEKTFWLGDFF